MLMHVTAIKVYAHKIWIYWNVLWIGSCKTSLSIELANIITSSCGKKGLWSLYWLLHFFHLTKKIVLKVKSQRPLPPVLLWSSLHFFDYLLLRGILFIVDHEIPAINVGRIFRIVSFLWIQSKRDLFVARGFKTLKK